ncbi:hypothetical protein D3C84_1232580 [compost metagenome]
MRLRWLSGIGSESLREGDYCEHHVRFLRRPMDAGLNVDRVRHYHLEETEAGARGE